MSQTGSLQSKTGFTETNNKALNTYIYDIYTHIYTHLYTLIVISIDTCMYSEVNVVKYSFCLDVCKFSLLFPPPPRYSHAAGKK